MELCWQTARFDLRPSASCYVYALRVLLIKYREYIYLYVLNLCILNILVISSACETLVSNCESTLNNLFCDFFVYDVVVLLQPFSF